MKLVALSLAFLQAHAASSEAPQLPKVPQVFNAGPDGLPQLADVEQLLKDYEDAKQHLDSEQSLAQHVSHVEATGVNSISQQKEIYDKQLQDQEKENQRLVQGNAQLAKEIIRERQRAAKMKKALEHQEKLMSFRQNQLRGLEQQLERSQKFFHELVDTTNFEESGEKGPATATEDDAVSFLEISKKRQHGVKKSLRTPLLTDESELLLEGVHQNANFTEIQESDATEKDQQIIALFTEDLQKLHQAEAHSRSLLKRSFQQSYEAGKKRREALRKQESVLTKELKQTEQMNAELQAKSAKVQEALDQMQKNLRKGGDFFGQLQKVAVAPVKEVEPLLKAVVAQP